MAVALASSTLPVGVAPSPAASAIAAPAIAPPAQRVYVVSDSVGLGARTAIPAAFPPGWDVTVDGTPALFVEQLESKHVRDRMATSPSVLGDIAVIAGGYNYPYWDPGRFDRSIDAMVATLRSAGVRRIFWVTLREVKPQFVSPGAWQGVQPYFWYFPTVNAHLRAALGRHPDLTLVDWAAAADRPGLTYDAIHLNPVGAALYAHLIASTVMSTQHRPLGGTVTRVQVPTSAGVVPAAVAVNLATTSARRAGFLTAFACGSAPTLAASATFDPAATTATAAIVPLAPDGSFCIYANDAVHVVVDSTGTFPAGAGVTPITPTRVADTRASGGPRQPSGSPLRIPVDELGGVPTDAAAVAITLTATGSSAPGFATATPCGAPPTGTASVNFPGGATVSNLAVVELGDGGEICVTSNVDAHLIVDVVAGIARSADVGIVEARRLLDTRTAGGRLGAGAIAALRVSGVGGVPIDATGVVLNVTGVDPQSDGYLTAYPCAAGAPLTSSLNLTAGVDRGNLVIVAPDAAGDVCVRTYGATDVVVDLVGWTGDAFVGGTPMRALDTRAT